MDFIFLQFAMPIRYTYMCLSAPHDKPCIHNAFTFTLFENENEWQKTEPVPIPLPGAFRNVPNVKTRKNFFFYNWTSEIIPFIHLGKQMDRT